MIQLLNLQRLRNLGFRRASTQDNGPAAIMHSPRAISRQDRRGAAIVELALVVPIMGAMLLAILEIGQSLKVESVLAEASSNACAAGSKPGYSNTNVQYEVSTALTKAGLSATAATVTILINDVAGGEVANAKRNDKIAVVVTIPWSSVSLLRSNFFFTSNSKLSNTSTMLKQG